jgi:Ni/Fe-hydrogenase b-type cytochrome subunit
MLGNNRKAPRLARTLAEQTDKKNVVVEPLIYRHNRVTRLTHWVNAIALTILLMSGLQIFNAFPHLHWGDKAEPGEAFLSISATDQGGEVRGYTELFGYRFDTNGVLGLQHTESGPSRQAFPSWITIPGYYWLAGGRRWHFFFAWLFALNGILYFIYSLVNGHLRKFLFTPGDAAKVPAMILYYLRLRRESPQEGEYNPLQKLAYTGVFVMLTPLILLSGLAMSPQLNVAFNWLPEMFGGRQAARSVHFILSSGFVAFTFGHVFMVLTTGVLNNMRSMTTGWYKEKSWTHEEPVRVQPFKEEMIHEPATMPPSKQLTTPEIEESLPVQENEQRAPGSAEQDDAIAEPESNVEEQPAVERSIEIPATESKESKTDGAE